MYLPFLLFSCILASGSARKEGNVLFNDTLNPFYLVIWHQTYYGKAIRHITVKQSDILR